MSPTPLPNGPGTPGKPGTFRAFRGDACPGALRLHAADDGFLARVRIPGGVLTADAARALGDTAGRLGDGALHLTSRGNVQLRGLRDGCGGDLAEALRGAGLLPSAAHERVRNVVASPLSGLDGAGFVDVRAWLTSLDAELCASSSTPALSGRFLFALDDGRGDVAGLGADVLLRGRADGAAQLDVGDAEFVVRYEDAARAAVVAAECFLAEAQKVTDHRAWRVRDLDTSLAEPIATALGPDAARGAGNCASHGATQQGDETGPPIERTPRGSAPAPAPQTPEGLDGTNQTLAATGPQGLTWTSPFGTYTPRQWTALTDVAAQLPSRELRLTPWRSIVVPGAGATHSRTLEAAGLTPPGVPLGACIGTPGCSKSRTDVRRDATPRHPTLPTYWSGCDRRCGHPAGPYLDVVAQPDGTYLEQERAEPRV